ncbi:MAG: FapA family protein, partial [bacterium]
MPTDKPFRLDFKSAGVFLVVDPSALGNIESYQSDIREELARKRVDKVDAETLEKFFGNPSSDVVLIAPPQPEPVDGKVLARMSPSGNEVEIKVEPPMGRGVKATMQHALKAIKDAGAGNFFLDTEKIEQMLSSFRFRDFVAVGERRGGRFDLTISKDKCEAILNLAPPFGGTPIEKDDIMRHLKREGVVYGIREEIIAKMVEREIYNEPTVIAQGGKPENGTDAKLDFFFDSEEKQGKPVIDDEGQVDFRQLDLIQSVRKGDPLVKKTPAAPGKEGRTIFDEVTLPRAGRDLPYPGGANTVPSTGDPNLVMATLDGQPRFRGNKVHVVPILEVPGDVDYSIGNIDFLGAVHIRGSVLSGFTVKAMGDIQIGGCVEIARIEAGGNISIRQGVLGQEKAILTTRGNLTAKFIDKATVYAEGDIYVDESIIYSKVSSAGEIHLTGKKGYIIGGVVRASKVVRANQLGASLHAPTLIEVGGSPSIRLELEGLE